jgi:hypothetical protein
MEQVSDLFHDLEEAGVLQQSSTSLKEITAACKPVDAKAAKATPQGGAQIDGPRAGGTANSSVWQRVVSLPEIAFSIGFSLLLIGLTMFIFNR